MLFKFKLGMLLLLITTNFVEAQIGGLTGYRFLALNPSARVAALGGSAPAIYENDVNLVVQNPSLLRPSMSNQLGLSQTFYLAGVQAGLVSYAYALDSSQTLGTSLQYVNYGTFTQTDPSGAILGTFNAGDYAFSVAYSKRLHPGLYVGGQTRFIYSTLGSYNSIALGIDAGVTYYMPDKLWTFSAVISNVGKQLKSYTASSVEELPFNLQLGISKRLRNAPFRFSVVANHLEKPGKLIYQNLNKPSLQKDLETGNVIPENITLANRIMGHVTTSAELLLGKNLYVGFGYNYLKRWEMGLKDVSGFTGFSWGFGITTTRFQFAYARASYMVNQPSDHLSLILFFNKLRKG